MKQKNSKGSKVAADRLWNRCVKFESALHLAKKKHADNRSIACIKAKRDYWFNELLRQLIVLRPFCPDEDSHVSLVAWYVERIMAVAFVRHQPELMLTEHESYCFLLEPQFKLYQFAPGMLDACELYKKLTGSVS